MEERKIIIDENLGTTPNEEVFRLAMLTRDLDFSPDHKILEIGSLLGKCTIAMASVAKHMIYTVDPHEGPWYTFTDAVEAGLVQEGKGPRDRRKEMGNTYDRFIENLKKYEVNEKVVVIKAFSDQVKWTAGPVCMLFLDGDHSYIWVKHDYEKFSPHVVMGGYICFHDYGKVAKFGSGKGKKNMHVGVRRAVDEILARGGELEVVEEFGTLLITRKIGEYAPDKENNPTPQSNQG